jgi:hypothetical protein
MRPTARADDASDDPTRAATTGRDTRLRGAEPVVARASGFSSGDENTQPSPDRFDGERARHRQARFGVVVADHAVLCRQRAVDADPAALGEPPVRCLSVPWLAIQMPPPRTSVATPRWSQWPRRRCRVWSR